MDWSHFKDIGGLVVPFVDKCFLSGESPVILVVLVIPAIILTTINISESSQLSKMDSDEIF